MTPNKSMIAGMTQPELRATLARDPVILVPMGSLEDQGPMTFGGDYLLAERIALLVAQEATAAGVEVIVSPVIPFGCQDAFAGPPGCIALSPGTFRLVVSEVLEPLLASGAKRIIILNGHGGNVEPITEVTAGIHERTGMLIPSVYLWKVAFTYLVELIGMEKARASGGHGANPLSSVAMHLFPELMRPELAEAPRPMASVMGLPATGYGTAVFEGIEVNIPVPVREISQNGVVGGDMREVNAAIGAGLTERLVGLVVSLAKHMATQKG